MRLDIERRNHIMKESISPTAIEPSAQVQDEGEERN